MIKPPSWVWGILAAVLLSGCFSAGAVQGAKSSSATVFVPEKAWRSPDGGRIALSGYRSVNGTDRVECIVYIPPAIVQKLTDEQNRVILSRSYKISPHETHPLAVYDGKVPADFVEMPTEPNLGAILVVALKTEHRPASLLALPATVVLDVATLPVQIPAAASLRKIQ